MSVCLLGAHTSAEGGVHNALYAGKEIKASTIQLFTSNQKRWKGKKFEKGDLEKWEKALEETGLQQVMSHASYLINLGSPKEELINELIPTNLYQEYPPEIIQNLKSSIIALIKIEKESRNYIAKKFVNNALQNIKKSDYSQAKNVLLSRYQNSLSDKNKSKYMVYVGNFEVFEDPNFALSYYEKAFSFDNKNYNALNNIGHIFRLMGDYNQALAFYSRLASLAQSSGRWLYVANATSNIGVVYQKMQEYSLAKKYYFEALEINNKLSNDLRAATQYYNLGTIYELMDKIEKACDKYRKARIIFYRNYRQNLVKNLDDKLKEIGCH